MPWPHDKVFFEDYIFNVYSEVYKPAEDSFLFAENLHMEEAEFVLDVGTGCGILAVIAADQTARVVAVDINPYAVKCARENARLNGVAGRTLFIQGDLFAPLKTEERFDLILFNAPYLPSEHSEVKSWLECAWDGGVAGREVINRFICRAPRYMKEDSCILMMQSTISNIDETSKRFAKKGLKTTVVAELAMPLFEKVILVKAQRLD